MTVKPSDLYDTAELAALLGIVSSTLRAMRSRPHLHRSIDGLPPPLRRVGNADVWDAATINEWMDRD